MNIKTKLKILNEKIKVVRKAFDPAAEARAISLEIESMRTSGQAQEPGYCEGLQLLINALNIEIIALIEASAVLQAIYNTDCIVAPPPNP